MSDTFYLTAAPPAAPVRLDVPLVLEFTHSQWPTEPTEPVAISLQIYLSTNFACVPYRVTVTGSHMSGSLDVIPNAANEAGAFWTIPLATDQAFRIQSNESVTVRVTAPDGRADPRNLFYDIPEEAYAARIVYEWQSQVKASPPATVIASEVTQEARYNPGERYNRIEWTGARNGASQDATIRGYNVFRSDKPEGPFSIITSSATQYAYWNDNTYTVGHKYWYCVTSVATGSASYSSVLSLPSNGCIASDKYNTYVAAPCYRGRTYNPRPRFLLRAPLHSPETDAPNNGIDFTKANNSAWVSSYLTLQPGRKYLGQMVSDVTDGAHTFSISYQPAVSGKFIPGSFLCGYTKATPVWTDPDLAAGMPIKAAHITEIRTCLDNLCDYYEVDRTVWGDAVSAGRTPTLLWPEHVAALQATVQRIADRINAWDTEDATRHVVLPAFADTTRPNAAAIRQLRDLIVQL